MSTIKKEINDFINQRVNNIHRYASFDFCYNYFLNNKSNLLGKNLQTSCCQLWAYLASWEMVARGNAMQSKSYAVLKDVIDYVNDHDCYYNVKLTDDCYEKEVLELYNEIDNRLHIKQKNRKTLITKIILGTYACCPAFDSRFCTTFGIKTQGSLSEQDLKKVIEFYKDNKEDIDSFTIETLPFDKETCHKYTTAKIIDMYGFMRNKKINKTKLIGLFKKKRR